MTPPPPTLVRALLQTMAGWFGGDLTVGPPCRAGVGWQVGVHRRARPMTVLWICTDPCVVLVYRHKLGPAQLDLQQPDSLERLQAVLWWELIGRAPDH